jgi:GxxExxY protein
MKHEQISREIIGAGMAMLNELKCGLDERLYENALVIELRDRGLTVEQQRSFPVFYKNHSVGTLVPDIIVAEKIIVEAKVVSAFVEAHISQAIGYMRISNLDTALLLNFKLPKLEWKRLILNSESQPRIDEGRDASLGKLSP